MSGIYLQSKKSKQGLQSVYIRVRTKEGSFNISTNISIRSKDFNKQLSRVKPSHQLFRQYNSKLEKLQLSVKYNEALYKAKLITFNELRDKSVGRKVNKPLAELLSVYSNEKSSNTLKAYQTAINALNRVTKYPLELVDINYTTIMSAIAYWKREQLSPASINTYVRTLITLRNDGYRRRLIDSGLVRERSFHQRETELEIRSITSEDFSSAIGRAKTRVEIDSLKLYLLSFVSRGLYFGDFRTMTPEVNSFTHYRHKTGNRMEIDGLDGLILKLYNSIDIKELKHSRVRKYQKNIKRLLGVSFKTARKTFDSYALLLDTDFQIRLHLLGQRDRSIKRYYTNFEMKGISDKVNRAHRRVVGEFNASEYTKQLLRL